MERGEGCNLDGVGGLGNKYYEIETQAPPAQLTAGNYAKF